MIKAYVLIHVNAGTTGPVVRALTQGEGDLGGRGDGALRVVALVEAGNLTS